MYTFTLKRNLHKHLSSISNEKTVGFVPTMGALHSGHLQLIKASKKECSITVCSIFINPTQFNNEKDLKKYPRAIKSDLKKLTQLDCDIVYYPEKKDLYLKDEKAKKYDFGSLTTYMEGEFRRGHFDGMATIVEKLLTIIKPSKAFFGQKDLQQLQIVKALVKKIKSETIIIGVPTVREESGLAKSSRNQLLDENGKQEATLIFKSLNYCRKNKEHGIDKLRTYIHEKFKKNQKFKLEYIEIVDLETMLPIKNWKEKNKSAICISAYHSGVRLIDNIIL